jgi:hypothetical protein
MKINYRATVNLIDIRMKQIKDVSLEMEYFNREWNELKKIRESLTNLIILERKTWKDFEHQKEPKKT